MMRIITVYSYPVIQKLQIYTDIGVGTVGAVGAIAPPLEHALFPRADNITPRAPPPSLRTRLLAGLAPPLQIVFLHLCILIKKH